MSEQLKKEQTISFLKLGDSSFKNPYLKSFEKELKIKIVRRIYGGGVDQELIKKYKITFINCTQYLSLPAPPLCPIYPHYLPTIYSNFFKKLAGNDEHIKHKDKKTLVEQMQALNNTIDCGHIVIRNYCTQSPPAIKKLVLEAELTLYINN